MPKRLTFRIIYPKCKVQAYFLEAKCLFKVDVFLNNLHVTCVFIIYHCFILFYSVWKCYDKNHECKEGSSERIVCAFSFNLKSDTFAPLIKWLERCTKLIDLISKRSATFLFLLFIFTFHFLFLLLFFYLKIHFG